MMTASLTFVPALTAAARRTTPAGSCPPRGRVRCCECPAPSEWLLRYSAASKAFVVAVCSWHGVRRAGDVNRLADLGRSER